MNKKDNLDYKALSQMVQIVVHSRGDQPEVSYLGGGRVRIDSMENVKAVTIAMPGYHDKTRRVSLIIDKRNQSEVSPV